MKISKILTVPTNQMSQMKTYISCLWQKRTADLMMTFQVIYLNNHLCITDIETSTNIAKTNVTRFALCLEKSAVQKILPPTSQSYEQTAIRDPLKEPKRETRGLTSLDQITGASDNLPKQTSSRTS